MKNILAVIAGLMLCTGALAQDNDALVKACLDGDLAVVKTQVEGGANVNYKNAAGQTPISCAFMWPEITQFLIDKGGDAGGGDYPAIVNASKFYSADVIKILLKAGVDPNKPATVKVDLAAGARTALEAEKAKGKKANKYLVKAYEDQIKTLPSSSMTIYPLAQAVGTNCKECVDLLLLGGAKPNEFKNVITGGNIMHEIAATWIPGELRASTNIAAIPYMEKAGIKMPDWYKNLDFASQGSASEIVYLLRSRGADMEALDNQKQTPLKTAFLRPPVPDEEVVTALVSNGANIKATGMNMTPTAFAEATDNPEKIKVRYDFPREGRNGNGGGYSANMDLVNPKPKRVALISYYVYDAGNGKIQGTNSTSATTTAWSTSDYVAQNQANGFYAKSIDAMKTAFKENGIDLLTPDQFLDTDEKKETYYGFDQQSAKKEKTEAKMWGKLGTQVEIGTTKASPAGKGYRTFFVANERIDESDLNLFQGGVFTANRKLTSNLGFELTKLLGVDAVVVVYIATRKPKMLQDDYAVNAVQTMMLGPNPGKSDEDANAKNLGQFYCGTRTFYQSPLIFKDNKSAMGQYDGLGNVLAAHANKICKYVNGKEKDED